MLRFAFGVGLVAMVLGGCGGGEVDPTTTTAPPSTTTTIAGGGTPIEAVTTWLDALSIGRYAAVDMVVIQEQFVLMLAVESYSGELYQDLVSDGISPTVSRTFWESFVGGVRGFTGAAITEVDVLGEQRFEAYGRNFAAVEVTSPRGGLTIVAIMAADGRWYVDLLATFGPSFAPLFNLWVDRLPSGVNGPRGALTNQQASLEVARDRVRESNDGEVEAELEALLARLAS